MDNIPSGKRLHNYGKSPLLMGKSTINTMSMAMFKFANCWSLPEGIFNYGGLPQLKKNPVEWRMMVPGWPRPYRPEPQR